MQYNRYGLINISTNLTIKDEFVPFEKRFDSSFFFSIHSSCADPRYKSIFKMTNELINYKMHKGAKLFVPLRIAPLENKDFKRELKDFLVNLQKTGYEVIIYTHDRATFNKAFNLASSDPLATKMIANEMFNSLDDFSKHLYGINSLAQYDWLLDLFLNRNQKVQQSHILGECLNIQEELNSPAPKEVIFRSRMFPSTNALTNDSLDVMVLLIFCLMLRKLLCSKPKTSKYRY